MADESKVDMMSELRTMNNSSDDPWHSILENVVALEGLVCTAGEFVEVELSHCTSFIVMLKDIGGANANPLVTLLQPAVDERLPVILFQLYIARRQLVHI